MENEKQNKTLDSIPMFSLQGNDVDSGSGWHSHSVKLSSTRYSTSRDSEIDLQIPTICVSGDRRTSISSQLRFSRTFSTDSLDSLEKQCLKEFRRQRFLMEDHDDKSPTETSPSTLLSPSSSTYPSLRNVGRSKTDPGGSENVTNQSQKCPFSGLSFDASKLGVSMDATSLKRSTPDLLDNVKPKTLKDIIGISSYQAKGLLQCWPNIYATGTSGIFASQLYSNLCRRNPKAKTILQKADGVAVFSQSGTDCTSMHVKLTLELIDTIIRNLDSNPTNIISYLTEIGQSHKALKDEGMSIALWDDFGDAILDGVRKNDLVRRHKELRRAWLAIIAFITDNIKQGHTSFRASPSSNDLNDQRKKETITDAFL
uniref:Globin n=1 Tax=Panagrolaimus sp. JU765 TaxID=591449 RepID=A0AC34QWU1_9BILA